jgi:hypothetical protein
MEAMEFAGYSKQISLVPAYVLLTKNTRPGE